MNRFPIAGSALISTLFTCALFSQATVQEEIADQAIEKGRYLAFGVAMCVDCHTPKMSNDLLDSTRLLMGTEIRTTPLEPVADWAAYAPAIAGLPNYSVDEVVEVLTTGTIGNTYLRPPMPVYRMNEEDARAIALYLKSLAPGQEELN
ncbi:MAG: cytochrome c [Opitutaceae bacterium]